ncbi:MAG: glycosyltransferase family 9 protein [Spirochaetia bacterium]|jgi:ADP-heptose:LPS heptosyltransferase
MASLVYHAGALGDFITTLPAIGAWRRLHPGEGTVLLGKPALALLALPAFDQTWDAEGAELSALFSLPFAATQRLADLLRQFSSALLFAAPSSPIPSALAALGVKEIVRQDPLPSLPVPIVDYHLSLFPGLSFDAASSQPRVAIPELEPDSVRATVSVHPGSGSALKNWPRERFSELCRRLSREGESVAWITGPAEADGAAPQGVREWRGFSLPVLAALLARSKVYIGNDSGVTHLAAAAGCPTIALFGASDPRVWAPRGSVVRVIISSSGDMAGISVDDVWGVVRPMLGQC